MTLLTTISSAQKTLANHIRQHRLNVGLTQEGLATRSGVKLPTLRQFEQKGLISLESFLKIAMVLGLLDNIVNAMTPTITEFSSIDDVLKVDKKPMRKKGWRK
ncbi:MAG: helix-turn-helix transcriptional regulator [Gammaproteobacteria bacterium]|nr:helix-turn-helix transcriptional regulator [Gammaproteobacteria bacterium]